MSKIICKICGTEEDTARWIDSAANKMREHKMCQNCLHWYEQLQLDKTERGPHGYAIIKGKHYTLLPATNGYFKGFGGRKFIFKFFDDESIVECENVWYQGTVPEGYWKELMPDNACFMETSVK